jgi:hypothetical protein
MTYFPFIRGQRFDLTAMREILPHLGTSEFPTTPNFIIEPVKGDLADLKKTVSAYESSGKSAKIILLINPMVGQKPSLDDLINIANANPKTVIPAFVPGNHNHRGSHTDFISKVSSNDVVLIHEYDNPAANAESITIRSAKNVIFDVETGKLGFSYIAHLTSTRVLIEDAFTNHPNNASYPSDEVFTGTHLLKPLSHKYYGDYTIMRKDYKIGGGKANAIALHSGYHTLTEIRMKHFVSDPSLISATQAVMYDDALKKLLSFSSTPTALHTLGLKEFIASKPKYPGLPKAKQFGVMHHLQLRSQ